MDYHTLVCIGDSNTYGYDPRSFWEDRYMQNWCSLLQELSGAKVVNLGENGRMVPTSDWEQTMLLREIPASGEGMLLIVLLGTNDILRGFSPEQTGRKLEGLIDMLMSARPGAHCLLLAPPAVRIPEFAGKMEMLARICGELAAKKGIRFGNPQSWNLQIAFDGMHLTQDDHEVFAWQVMQLIHI